MCKGTGGVGTTGAGASRGAGTTGTDGGAGGEPGTADGDGSAPRLGLSLQSEPTRKAPAAEIFRKRAQWLDERNLDARNIVNPEATSVTWRSATRRDEAPSSQTTSWVRSRQALRNVGINAQGGEFFGASKRSFRDRSARGSGLRTTAWMGTDAARGASVNRPSRASMTERPRAFDCKQWSCS